MRHSIAEDRRDIDGLVATLAPDCVYELIPTGQRCGAEHDDDPVEAALALVEVVGQVAGEYVGSPVERMTGRSRSSPNCVLRSHTAPSAW